MPEYVALLFADAHERERRGDEAFALQQIADAAVRRGVKCVVAAGDLLDKQANRARAVVSWSRFVEHLEQHGIEFFFIEGQHEADTVAWLGVHRWATCLHQHVAKLGPYTAYGLSFQTAGRLQEELARIPSTCDLLIAHQTWADWMGDITSPQGAFCEVPGHIKAVFTGDLHQRKLESVKNAAGRNMLVCSPGATVAQKIDEPHDNYYVLMTADGTFEFKKLRSRPFIDWPVMNRPEDLNAFASLIEAELAKAAQRAVAQELPEYMAKPLLRYTFSSRLEDAKRRVERLVAGRVFLFERELPPEEKVEAWRERRPATTAAGAALTPLNVLPEVVDRDERPAVFELASRLLQPGDYKSAFQAWCQEYLGEEE